MAGEIAARESASVSSAVQAYCNRIGYHADLAPTLATLRALHRAHVGSIVFENIDVLLGRPGKLDRESLQQRLVERRRGGYCFEQNLLFKDVLEELGYRPTGLAARVRGGTEKVRPRTHMLLRIEADHGQPYLADVGFGGTGLLEPIPLVAERENEFPIFRFRLMHEGELWVLQAARGGLWSDLYAFSMEPQERIDYEVAHHFTSTYPQSVFVQSLTAQLTRPEERLILRNRDFTILRGDAEERRQVSSSAEAKRVLEHYFGIVLDADARLPERLFA